MHDLDNNAKAASLAMESPMKNSRPDLKPQDFLPMRKDAGMAPGSPIKSPRSPITEQGSSLQSSITSIQAPPISFKATKFEEASPRGRGRSRAYKPEEFLPLAPSARSKSQPHKRHVQLVVRDEDDDKEVNEPTIEDEVMRQPDRGRSIRRGQGLNGDEFGGRSKSQPPKKSANAVNKKKTKPKSKTLEDPDPSETEASDSPELIPMPPIRPPSAPVNKVLSASPPNSPRGKFLARVNSAECDESVIELHDEESVDETPVVVVEAAADKPQYAKRPVVTRGSSFDEDDDTPKEVETRRGKKNAKPKVKAAKVPAVAPASPKPKTAKAEPAAPQSPKPAAPPVETVMEPEGPKSPLSPRLKPGAKVEAAAAVSSPACSPRLKAVNTVEPKAKPDGINHDAQPDIVFKRKGVTPVEKKIGWQRPSWARQPSAEELPMPPEPTAEAELENDIKEAPKPDFATRPMPTEDATEKRRAGKKKGALQSTTPTGDAEKELNISAEDSLDEIKEAPTPAFATRPTAVRGMSFESDTAEASRPEKRRAGKKDSVEPPPPKVGAEEPVANTEESLEEIKEAPRPEFAQFTQRPAAVRGMSFEDDHTAVEATEKRRGGKKEAVKAPIEPVDPEMTPLAQKAKLKVIAKDDASKPRPAGINKEAQPDQVLKNKGVTPVKKKHKWQKPSWARQNSEESLPFEPPIEHKDVEQLTEEDELDGIKEAPKPDFAQRPDMIRGLSFDDEDNKKQEEAAEPQRRRGGKRPNKATQEQVVTETELPVEETEEKVVDELEEVAEDPKPASNPARFMRPGLMRGMSFEDDHRVQAEPFAGSRGGRQPAMEGGNEHNCDRPATFDDSDWVEVESSEHPDEKCPENVETDEPSDSVGEGSLHSEVVAVVESDDKPEWVKKIGLKPTGLADVMKAEGTLPSKSVGWQKPTWAKQ